MSDVRTLHRTRVLDAESLGNGEPGARAERLPDRQSAPRGCTTALDYTARLLADDRARRRRARLDEARPAGAGA
jgi:hypothetical protein